MSDTPRVDQVFKLVIDDGPHKGEWVRVEFARYVERELTARRAKYGTKAGVHPLYSRWTQMWKRCNRPSHSQFAYYGARGIRVCERWRDFWAFVEDMGEPPASDMTLDRIDTNGHYEPSNCRWATLVEQANNKRNNRRLTVRGEVLTVAQACRKYGLNKFAVYDRLKLGWSEAEAVLTPLGKRGGRHGPRVSG